MHFLDESKAFNRVKHCILFQKSIDWVCLDILLDCLYIGTLIRLLSGDLSEHFGVTNGVTQGGILLLYLFNNICIIMYKYMCV